MTVDFALTQFYRLVVDDIVLLCDVYMYYRRFKTDNRSIKEFSEVLVELMEVEAQNFEGVAQSKLSHDRHEKMGNIVWDYFMSIVVRYVLDDLSQYPFWSAKIVVAATHDEKFGWPVVKAYWDYIKEKVTTGQIRSLYDGVGPYLCASFVMNFDYIRKCTNSFITSVLSKVPQQVPDTTDPVSIEGTPIKLSGTAINALRNSVSSPNKTKSKNGSSSTPGYSFNEFIQRVTKTVISHPFVVLSVSMIKDPFLRGDSWLYAYFKFTTSYGISAFYRGLRSRVLFGVLPVSPFLLLGITDTIAYRQMIGQGSFDSTGGVLSVAREITAHDSSGSAMGILNYGLLTACHLLPGFLSFVGVRSIVWMLFGSSSHRKHQLYRRKEIVEAHFLRLKKRSNSYKQLSTLK